MFVRHRERHRTARLGWLRAAVLGANDGVVSTASLILGVAATSAWALSGSSLRSLMTSPQMVRAFNIVMAVLLLASLYPVFMEA